ncbi:MAG: phosphomannose isomerase type II C-terminal cupin domain [Patescibacteria group bacterium]|nr:phosphomannose isomerase type II C-terminal cupin domain [Patescibacteria group bacterium]
MATVQFESRPWGEFSTYEDHPSDTFWVKKLTLKPGGSLSLQKHDHRKEFWVCVQGEIIVRVNGEQQTLHAGDFVCIERLQSHIAQNPSKKDDAVLIETATGVCLETDNKRIEDQYGRADNNNGMYTMSNKHT